MERIRRSESDLKVFISSRQTAEMKVPRQKAKEAIERFPNCRAWLFESMPASSESPHDRYVRNANEADFVIWLVGEKTTQPIVDEINACISTEGRLLAFILPNKSCDALTKELMQTASKYATWREVEDIDDLYKMVKASLSDEINRIIRDSIPRGREQKLRELQQRSIARCTQYFTTLGVSDAIAEEMATCKEIGYSPPIPEAGVVKIVGAQGVGKTLAAERVLQNAIDNAIGDSSQPFPVFVRARNLDNRLLHEFIEAATRGYANPSIQGALVVIDGLDEVGITSANGILEDAAVYARANPKAVVVVTTRPMVGLKKDIGSDAVVPRLDDSDALALISKVAGRSVWQGHLSWLDEPLREVATLPLFAIMIGSEFAKNPNFVYPTQTHLVAQVANRALQRMDDHAEDIEDLLQRLAVKVIQNKGSIAKSEVDRRATVHRRLLNTRLVAEENNKIDFTLSVFREWFGARAIVERELSFDELKSEIEQWIIPITIAMRSEDEDLGLSLMSNLASTDPGIASKVLDELEDNRSFTRGTESPSTNKTSQEVGLEIRKAMEDWGDGLMSELMREIGPVKQNGELCPLGISLESNWVSVSWYRGTNDLEPIVEAPDFQGYRTGQYIDPGWRSLFRTTVNPTKYWPWVLTKDRLVDSLKEEIEARRLSLMSDDSIRELSYEFAQAISKPRFARSKSIDIREVLAFIDENLATGERVVINSSSYNELEIQAIASDLSRMLKNGESFISAPWPGPDIDLPAGKTSWWWHERYSDGRLLERTIAIYGAALRIYTDMTDTYFKKLGTHSRMRNILPAKLEGRLIIPSSYETFRDSPTLTWWPRPLGKHEQSKIDFQLEYEDDDTYDRIDQMAEVARIEVSEQSDIFWHTTQFQLHLDGERPATDLAYEWLKSDLRDIGWGG